MTRFVAKNALRREACRQGHLALSSFWGITGMTTLSTVAQRILGLIFLVFGLNGFFHFIRMPAMAPQAQKFIMDLVATHYMLPFWKGTEVAAGALLFVDFH